MEPNDASVTDLALLGRALEEHRSRLLVMLRQRIDPTLQPRIDAEEILQEAYLAARAKWGRTGRDPAMTTYAWLYRIARDTLIEVWRKQTRDCRDVRLELTFPEHSSIQMGLQLVHGGTSPSAACARKEEGERVLLALARLKPADREILWMRHNDGLSYSEVAVVLGITANAAGVRYLRAMKRLREFWH